jgi:hypothetical protein
MGHCGAQLALIHKLPNLHNIPAGQGRAGRDGAMRQQPQSVQPSRQATVLSYAPCNGMAKSAAPVQLKRGALSLFDGRRGAPTPQAASRRLQGVARGGGHPLHAAQGASIVAQHVSGWAVRYM